ncbi:phosphomannose isomerase type II C-terminal cupin domain [Aestuariivirga sp.]|uniref:phosphomannose isomerase type II C-terminal cupin domain n=1 Tax=Aestuariivirga sp. TaxID=2650926 RepID=UPI0039E64AA1
MSEKRPWGEFAVLHLGHGFKVKRLLVAPGGRLSLQSHQHRSEHWTVVSGIATVIVGDHTRCLAPGGAIDVPLGARHRLENKGETPLELIEIQFGDILSEDDITRYEDAYGRCGSASLTGSPR